MARRFTTVGLALRREAGDSHDGALADTVQCFQLHHRLEPNAYVCPTIEVRHNH
jgi:hypothetical protein